ncbi:MAG: DNA primase [Lachnospiraceae bacterium]|nr:DNA primase [Lachnospiraceae bacterium]
MNVFEAIKRNVTTRQAAEMYGIRVNRYGMAVCPFHNDKNPSMKVDKRFHCFACQADGDAVDFVSRLFELPSKEAAMKLADDFGIRYDSRQKPSVRAKIREPTPEQRYQQEENRCYRVLTDYFHSLRAWKQQYAPKQPEDEWHPLFVEALQRESYLCILSLIQKKKKTAEKNRIRAPHSRPLPSKAGMASSPAAEGSCTKPSSREEKDR